MKREPDRVPVARYRLSPNEEARLLREEREKKKKNRLLMVRQQSKEISKNILKDVKAEKQKQIQILAEEIKENWEVDKEAKLQQLEELYEKNLKHVGEAHVAAVEEDVDGRLEDRLLVKQEDARVMLERGQKALEKLKNDLLQREMAETRQIRARQDALEKEKDRASYIASKPPPEKDPVDELQIAQMKPVKFTDHDAFSTTHYHIPAEYGVVKEQQLNQDSAKATAELESERYDDVEAEKKRVEIERREKARVRHKVALEKERLDLDYGHILHELSDLQKSDRVRRQKVVANLPKQIFIPPSNRLQELDEQQKGMERAFEDMFIAGQSSEVKDLILDSEPVPAALTDESSVTTLDESVPRAPFTQHSKDLAQSSLGESTVRQILDTSKPPDTGLKQLLGKIKCQRETWVRASNGQPGGQRRAESADQSLTQYTVRSTDTKTGSQQVTERSEVDTLSTGEVETKSTMSTQSQSLGETEHSSVEEGSITSSGTITESRPTQSDVGELQTLSHPLEKAAQLRQTQPRLNGISQYLTKERRQQEEISRENRVIKQEAEQRRQHLEAQKQELEDRLRELEMKRLELHSRSQEASGRFTRSTSHPPQSYIVPQAAGVGILQGVGTRTSALPSEAGGGQLDLTHSSTLTSGGASSSVDIGRVREYQEKLLRRHGNQQDQMRQAREDLQKRVEEMLDKAKSDYNSVPPPQVAEGTKVNHQHHHLPTFPRVSPLPDTTSPLGYFKDISPRLSAMHEGEDISGRRPAGQMMNGEETTMFPLRPSVGSMAEDRRNNSTTATTADLDLRQGIPRSLMDDHRKALEQQDAFQKASVTTPQSVYDTRPMDPSTADLDLREGVSRSLADDHALLHRRVLEQQVASQQASVTTPEFVYNTRPMYTNSSGVSGSSTTTSDGVASTSGLGLTQHDLIPPPPVYASNITGPSAHTNTNIHHPVSGYSDPTVKPMSDRYSDRFTDQIIDPLSRPHIQYPTVDPVSGRHTDQVTEPVSDHSEMSRYRESVQTAGTLTSEAEMRVDIASQPYEHETPSVASNQFEQPTQPPPLQPYRDFERRDLSTILEVDSPEKTAALSRLSGIDERELSGVGIPESGPVWKATTSERFGTQYMPLEATGREDENSKHLTTQESGTFTPLDEEEDSRFPPLLYPDGTKGTSLYPGLVGFEETGGTSTTLADTQSYYTPDTSTVSAGSKPMDTRNWHHILAENSQTSTVGQQPYLEQTRGIPVGESEPVSSRLSQYRQDIVIGAEEDSTGVNQFAPVSASGFAPLLSNDTDNTFASTIPDDLPRDRNAFLELQECSPSEKEFNKPAPYNMRPLSSTPARKDIPVVTDVSDLRKAALLSSKAPAEPASDPTVPGYGRYSDAMPSEIFSIHNTNPSVTMATMSQTPSTGVKTQEISQYALSSGRSSSGSESKSRDSARSTDNDLTQYKSGYKSRDDTTLPPHSVTPGGGVAVSTAGYNLGNQTDPSQPFRMSKTTEFSLTQYSMDPNHTTRTSQFGPTSAEYSSSSSKSGSQPEGSAPASASGSQTDSQAGSQTGSESVFSDERHQAQDSKASVVRFASGDPDVRMMSASSSDIGFSQPLTSQGRMPSTTQGLAFPTFSTGLTDRSRPTTIGENREEESVSIGVSGQMSSVDKTPLDDLTRRIEETMRKHERLLEESKRMSDRHEEERQRVTTEGALEFTVEDTETGITDEPDLTLLSINSDNISQHYNGNTINDANSSGKVTDVSLLSFEQHEKSLVLTPSDHTGDVNTGDTSNSLLSFERHERSQGSSLEGSNGYDKIFGLRRTSPTPLEGSSPTLFVPLSSDHTNLTATDPQQSTASSNNLHFYPSTTDHSGITASPSTGLVTMETLSSAGSDTTLTPTPQNTGSLFDWEWDEFTPLRMEEATQEEEGVGDNRGLFDSDSHVISIPVGKVHDLSEEDSVQGLSLQEVFARKKGHLIQKSQQRKEAAKVKGKQGDVSRGDHMTKTMAHWKKNRGLGKATKIPSPTKVSSKSSADRKREEQEMKQRTSRLYNQLDDVKEKKQEDAKKQKYAANRERAKEYNKKLQETRLKKKAEGK